MYFVQDLVDNRETMHYLELMEKIGWFFFDLFILGYVEDPVTGSSFRFPGGPKWAVYIEVSLQFMNYRIHSLKYFHFLIWIIIRACLHMTLARLGSLVLSNVVDKLLMYMCPKFSHFSLSLNVCVMYNNYFPCPYYKKNVSHFLHRYHHQMYTQNLKRFCKSSFVMYQQLALLVNHT